MQLSSIFKFFAHFSAHSVYVPLKVAAVYKLSQNILLKGRNGAGIKAELF